MPRAQKRKNGDGESMREVKRLSDRDIRSFQRRIFRWYRTHGRQTLPWRTRPTPYGVLVSEVMLQQTPVSRVGPKYQAWLKRFPSLYALSRASGHDVLRAWSGLGYNRRAILLRDAARTIQERYHGRFPRTQPELRSLPGVGPYTAAAIQIFSWNKDEVCLDTNIRRVIIAEFDLPATISDAVLAALAVRLLPRGRSRLWHSALMDYGALVATSRKTKIGPRTKQTTFQGSLREARGYIIKLLAEHGSLSSQEMMLRSSFARRRIDRAVLALEQDRLIRDLRGRYYLVR